MEWKKRERSWVKASLIVDVKAGSTTDGGVNSQVHCGASEEEPPKLEWGRPTSTLTLASLPGTPGNKKYGRYLATVSSSKQ